MIVLRIKPIETMMLPTFNVGSIYDFKDLVGETTEIDISSTKSMPVIFYGFKKIVKIIELQRKTDVLLKNANHSHYIEPFDEHFVFFELQKGRFIFVEYSLWGNTKK